MASGDVSPFRLPGPPRTKIIEENIDTVRDLVEEKHKSSISEVYNFAIGFYSETKNYAITLCGLMKSCGWKNPLNSFPELVSTVERYAAIASIKIKSLLLQMIFYQEPKFATNLIEGQLSTNLNPSRKDLIVNFYCGYFSLKCQTLGNTDNIITI